MSTPAAFIAFAFASIANVNDGVTCPTRVANFMIF
jgi:hypothetical protein